MPTTPAPIEEIEDADGTGRAASRSAVRSLLRLWPYVRPVRARLFTAAVVAVVASCTGLVIPLVLKWIVDGPVADRSTGGVWLGALCLLLLGFAEAALFGLRRWLVARPLAGVEAAMRADLYRHLQRLPIAFHDRWASGQLLSRGTTDLMLLRMFLAFPLTFLLVNSVTIVVGVLIMLAQDWTLGLVLLAPAVPVMIVCWLFEKRYSQVARQAQDQVGDLTTLVEESVLGIRIIKGFGRHRSQALAFRDLSRKLRGTELAKARLLAGIFAAITTLPELAVGAALVLGTVQVADGSLSAGTLVAFLSTALALRWPVESIGFLLAMSQEAATATERYFEVMDAEPESPTPPPPSGPAMPSGAGASGTAPGAAGSEPAAASGATASGLVAASGLAGSGPAAPSGAVASEPAEASGAAASGAAATSGAAGSGPAAASGAAGSGPTATSGTAGSEPAAASGAAASGLMAGSGPAGSGPAAATGTAGSGLVAASGPATPSGAAPGSSTTSGSGAGPVPVAEAVPGTPSVPGTRSAARAEPEPGEVPQAGAGSAADGETPGGAEVPGSAEAAGGVPAVGRGARPHHGAPLTSTPRGGAGGDGEGGLRFERVRFRYPDAEPDSVPVLDGIDLHIRHGETMALVGGTGSGKTTLTALVPRLHEVTTGRITLDGVDITAMPRERLRALVAVAFEEPTLFSAGVGENVLMGAAGTADEADLNRALAVAQADFVHALPYGTDTQVGEQGLSLSGGQRQRLALARAVVGNPRFLVLDDPLSALDVHTEALVEAALRRVLAGTTALVVAHRPSTVMLADRVALLSGGRITAVGTHRQLLRTSAEYAWLMSGRTETTERENR